MNFNNKIQFLTHVLLSEPLQVFNDHTQHHQKPKSPFKLQFKNDIWVAWSRLAVFAWKNFSLLFFFLRQSPGCVGEDWEQHTLEANKYVVLQYQNLYGKTCVKFNVKKINFTQQSRFKY